MKNVLALVLLAACGKKTCEIRYSDKDVDEAAMEVFTDCLAYGGKLDLCYATEDRTEDTMRWQNIEAIANCAKH